GQLAERVKHSRVMPLPGRGLQPQFLVHEDDLVAAISRCLALGPPATTVPITIAHEKAWALRSILEEIARAYGREVAFVQVPWQLIWAGLRCAELMKVPIGTRSDSLISLNNQNLHALFNAPEILGTRCREFTAILLKP
ncbi:MAG: hypothetical protein WAW96_01530, partial [Alphaproteobacteria bacterium]